MIFIGDIAHPFSTPPDWPDLTSIWGDDIVIANLEGALVKDGDRHIGDMKLFNHVGVIEQLKKINVAAVSLANNHILDIPDSFNFTLDKLIVNGILFYGAGVNIKDARSPILLQHNGHETIILGAGWTTIECIAASEKNCGVNPLNGIDLITQVKELRKNNSNSRIIITPHWNYSMEPHPQPAHRELAFRLIDNGADAVIGHHAHCVGGVEVYNRKIIAYSLGNWWLPHSTFFDGKLMNYPDRRANIQLALEWNDSSEPVLHWFKYEKEQQRIIWIDSSPLSACNRNLSLTPYQGYSHKEYIKWFRKNRLKKRALPIYKNYNDKYINALKDTYVKYRHHIIKYIRI